MISAHLSKRTLPIVGLLVLGLLLFAFAAPPYKSVAKLFGESPLRGSATCIARTGPMGPYRVDVTVTSGQPGESLDVEINGESVGEILIDGAGNGMLRINQIGQPLGQNDSGDTITVGDLSGVFFDRSDADMQAYRLQGSITDIVGVRYVVKYTELFASGALERRWEVTITNGEPQQSVPTFVRHVFIRPLLPDASGTAKLRMKTAAFINPVNPGPWAPLPNSFPSLMDGEVVQVGTSYIAMHRK